MNLHKLIYPLYTKQQDEKWLEKPNNDGANK